LERYHPIACSTKQLAPVRRFRAQAFTGTWYAAYRLAGTTVPDAATVRIEHAQDGRYTAHYNGLRYVASHQNKKCVLRYM
jgi:hypothetical protein